MELDEHEILSDTLNYYDMVFKIIIIGDSSVGKSCLALKATKNIYLPCYNPTIGFEYFPFNLKILDKVLKLQIWDTCGQETYRSLVINFYRNCSCAIIVFAINK